MIKVGVVLGSKPSSFAKNPHYAMEIRYFTALEKAGMLAVPVTYSNIEEQLAGLDAVLLPGGDFSVPSCYYVNNQETDYVDEGIWFDAYMAIGQYCLNKNIPILAICGGMQILGILLGGKLSMGLENHRHSENNVLVHDIEITKNTILHDIFKQDKIKINSIHREYVAETSDKIRVSAVSDDGIIEAIESKEHDFALGVQWHPECLLCLEKCNQIKIFEKLKEYCELKSK